MEAIMEIQHVEVLEDEEPYREVKRSQVRNEGEDDIKIMKDKQGPQAEVNPFISVSPSKPLMSSGSRLGNLLFISNLFESPDFRSSYHQGQYLPRVIGGLTANLRSRLFYQGHYLPCSHTLQYYLR